MPRVPNTGKPTLKNSVSEKNSKLVILHAMLGDGGHKLHFDSADKK